MKKAAIFTLNGYYNYGNRLQNYAVQEVIESFGFQAETIISKTILDNRKVSFLDKVKKSILSPNKIIQKVENKLRAIIYKKINQERTNSFKKFSQTYIKETDFVITEENIPDGFSEKYDFFVVGSDQIWNPYNRKGSPLDFLTFAPREKRIAYAPSFGISEIPKDYIERYTEWISEMKSLSVREEAGAKIIKKFTQRDAVVLLDPTMMLTKKKWLSISKKSPFKPNKKYLLTYFLGTVTNEYKNKIKSIAKNNNLVIVSLNNIKDRKFYSSDPSEFIDFINHASVICTDSFHGAVFSIIFEKPFVVFERIGKTPSMNSRIETLLSTFNFESRLEKYIVNNNDVFDIDFSHVPKILDFERKKTKDFLRNAFEM